MLSICMIMKNEERLLEKCLMALKPLNAELIIVDTGSTDSSKAIAAKYTDKLYDFTWTCDFSAARNYAISKATNDCILTIDADEILSSHKISELNKAIDICTCDDKGCPPVGRIICKNHFMNNNEKSTRIEALPRMFSKRFFRYDGIIHEQLIPIDSDISKAYIDTSLEFDHYGYYGDEQFITTKTDRNINLLISMNKENPDDPYIMYQLGKSYYMRGDYSKACDIFDKCLYHDLDPRLEYVQDLVVSYGYTLINTEQYETALGLEGVYNDMNICCEYIFLMGLIYMNNGLFDKAISEFRKATTFKSCSIEGSNSYLANYNIGVIYECTGNTKVARNFYQKCRNYEPAKARLALL